MPTWSKSCSEPDFRCNRRREGYAWLTYQKLAGKFVPVVICDDVADVIERGDALVGPQHGKEARSGARGDRRDSAVTRGADDWTDIDVFGKVWEAWLRPFLPVPHGTPSDDTFRRVFQVLDRSQCAAALLQSPWSCRPPPTPA